MPKSLATISHEKSGGVAGKVGKALLYTGLGGAVHWICQKAGHTLAPAEITGIVLALAATGEKLVESTGHLGVHVIGERLNHALFHSDEDHSTLASRNASLRERNDEAFMEARA